MKLKLEFDKWTVAMEHYIRVITFFKKSSIGHPLSQTQEAIVVQTDKSYLYDSHARSRIRFSGLPITKSSMIISSATKVQHVLHNLPWSTKKNPQGLNNDNFQLNTN